tara:strand:- start:3811 stop:5139 length:1329 start_codon:yes stop_codon:yes gene_type:complete
MRSYRDELEKNGFKIEYKNSFENDFKDNYESKLKKFILTKKLKSVSFFEIEDKSFEKKILGFLKENQIEFHCHQTPMFLSDRKSFKEYLDKTRRPFMANFYKDQRIKNKILVEDNKPKFGKWSFDGENRKKIPKNFSPPKQVTFIKSNHTLDISKFVNENFPEHLGNTEDFWIGTTREDAWACFENFLENKFNFFGDYEDAVYQKDNILFHSALSPFINIGLITPKEIMERIKEFEGKIKINSYEGFIRQIIGWREFMRGIYQNYEKKLLESNFFNHEKKMKNSWYDGSTGLEPLDYAIRNALTYGWSHHIERLMILSNIMNLCEIKPNIIFNWFMEMYIDSSEWVMSPNVFGMGLFSDGGIFATKPYICGSSYFLKMMDFKKGDWCNIMDGLYWRFIEKKKEFFLKNPRLSMMVRILDKMDKDRKKMIFEKAETFIQKNTC